MNLLKFFVYQVVFSMIAIANNYFFKDFIYEQFHINNKLIVSLIKTPIDLVIIYFAFKLYSLLKIKLRYRILIHIGAFIVGFVILGLILNQIVM
ncbi:hypothetical protein BKP45_06615 [Anaerobacillus alkalidiazotrophicus]|uniref:Uncharacterized protein n=1 Tax=Anaerobacillus alkalidiazotrophicus TaxID=472963 RepID=A0A1S2MCJ2_9BACI|nr:hypothetical protein BKP45_06615 [Anaerobacillus alkalidiazotrophicus]